MSGFWEAAAALWREGVPFVAVTLVSARGHAPQDPAAKALVTERGLHWGTVGGGKVEARAIAEARELLGAGFFEPRLETWNLQRDIGMTCGGEVTYLFEASAAAAPWPIVVFGAGHVAQALVRALLPLRCQLTVVDHRAEWMDCLPPAGLMRRHLTEPAAAVADAQGRSFFVVMTQGHATDVPILEAISRVHPQAPYVGVIGSRVKATKIRAELRARGVGEGFLSKLRCPIGLDFGGNDPAEIAVSVAAELLQARDGAKPPREQEAHG